MDMRRYFQLMNYWMKHPPAHLSIRAIIAAFGGKPDEVKELPPGTDNVKQDTGLLPLLMNGRGGAKVTRKKPPKWPTKTS